MPSIHASGASTGEAAWLELAERAVGRSLEHLESRTVDGLTIEPLHARRREDPLQPWRPDPAWAVAQRIDHPDPQTANRLALDDLEGGADALVLVGSQSPYARGYGFPVDAASVDHLLDRVELDLIAIRLDTGGGTVAATTSLAGLVDRRHLASAALRVDVGFDPIGRQMRLGRPCAEDPAPIFELRAKAGFAGTIFLADGRPAHEAGASEAQELAATLATAVAYLRRGEALGFDLDAARGSIGLLLAADADVMLGIAKFRAIRRLWASVEQACGLEARPVRLHAETSWRMMTRFDPWTNAMRTTSAVVAAGIGGADCVTVLPFSSVLGLPNGAARRLARNTQRILLDEAHLAAVSDPAAGAGGFEAMTETLCNEAWRLFQSIEREGGMTEERARSSFRKAIAETARARANRIARMDIGVVGTSRFATLAGPRAEILDMTPREEPRPGPDSMPALRDAEPFERLRERAECEASTTSRPLVFLATLGSPADFGASAAFAINFLAVAGLAAEAPLQERDAETQIAEFVASGASTACLCASQGSPPNTDDLVARLRTAGATRVLAVGRPPDMPSEDASFGVDAFIHDGCDALSILAEISGASSGPASALGRTTMPQRT